MSTPATLPEIDPAYFNEVWAADLDVLENLERNGDHPSVLRFVDVSFRGDRKALEKLAVFAERFGFAELPEQEGDGSDALFIGREQPADVQSIKELTKLSLQFEALFGVELDGWGCVAQTGIEN